ncbi:hypothetical protein E2P81_ATG00099 [Venturia nashicola]|uniref:SAM and PH domain-containing protein n=1 Tax=Venturia nashicola TaxID=86259 RepID=A0A4Z1PME7_9PEZI|nr:hypothetical protein E6O75_ATG00106 [Venturia nashicola]TLD39112.1 hypothetical protein E2P81_ATG00099 [Venturia nashicola]
MIPLTPISPLEGEVDMFSRGKTTPLFSIDTQLANRQSLLSVVPEVETPTTLLAPPELRKHRPISEVTEIWDEEDPSDGDDYSEFEEDLGDHSSWDSNDRRRSRSTISTYEEVSTPLSVNRTASSFFQPESRRSVEGPRGPHLFRASNASELSFDYALQLSPLVANKGDLRIDTAFENYSHNNYTNNEVDHNNNEVNVTPATTIALEAAKFTTSYDDWRMGSPSTWTTQQVSLWMNNSGVESAIVDKFDYHDITGKVLMDLQFTDLKELGIDQFGKRHEVWNKICTLREGDGRISPVPTPFEDASNRSSQGSRSSNRNREQPCEESGPPPAPGQRRRRKYRNNDPITPADSVSIVAIEQLVPRPHKCEKGENCSKWKRQQKLLQRIREENMFPISPENGGRILMSGNPGNALNAQNLMPGIYRPRSAPSHTPVSPSLVGPSIVASSDLFGPGERPQVALDEDTLKQIEKRDAQENVKHFLALQGIEPHAGWTPSPPVVEEPLQMFPPLQPVVSQPPLAPLQALPRLQIPRSNSAGAYIDLTSGKVTTDAFADTMSPCMTAMTPGGLPYRFGTPASEMDVPYFAPPVDPLALARETSQSVPPNMFLRDPVARGQSSQGYRRPSFQLPSLQENEVFSPVSGNGEESSSRRSSKNTMESNDLGPIPETRDEPEVDPRYPGVNHAGWMKKRKTKMLRHEWNDHHFRLTGNRLAMHRNDIAESSPMDTLNIDHYDVGCSIISSNKLAARFKALKIASGDKKDALKDAFEFQLVPERALQGKTHHFAVKSKDDRIDWMRELMLAKALKAKREGYDVDINGKGM